MFAIDTGRQDAPPAPTFDTPASSPFEKHGIKHLSASSINLWINAPDVWVAKYLCGMKQSFGAAPRRGQCVEDAVVAALQGKPVSEALRIATEKFDLTFPHGVDNMDKEREVIAPMTEQALAVLREYGEPEFMGEGQDKVEIRADMGAWSMPIIGFLDLVFPKHGLIIDLKTTNRMPSEMSAEHKLQRSIYAKARGNHAVKFLYVSAKKTALLEDGDPTQCLKEAKTQIYRLARFLNVCDKDTALQIVPHNPTSFYWNGSAPQRFEYFGT